MKRQGVLLCDVPVAVVVPGGVFVHVLVLVIQLSAKKYVKL
jgi:hypothetical protein